MHATKVTAVMEQLQELNLVADVKDICVTSVLSYPPPTTSSVAWPLSVLCMSAVFRWYEQKKYWTCNIQSLRFALVCCFLWFSFKWLQLWSFRKGSLEDQEYLKNYIQLITAAESWNKLASRPNWRTECTIFTDSVKRNSERSCQEFLTCAYCI